MKQQKCPSCGTKNQPHAYKCSHCGEIFRASKEKYNKYIKKEQEYNNIKIVKKDGKNIIKENKNPTKLTKTEKAEKIINNAGRFSYVFGIITIILSILLFPGGELTYIDLIINLIAGILYITLGAKIKSGINKKTKTYLITISIISIIIGLTAIIISESGLRSLILGIISIRALLWLKNTDKNNK